MLTNPNMNRRERRAAEALQRQREAAGQGIPPARADGRPQYYDIGGTDRAKCYFCVRQGLVSEYHVGQVVMCDPANPPPGRPKGEMLTVCVHHLPENAVIYNPRTNMCRNKAGDHSWEEGVREDVRKELRNHGKG